MSILLSSQIEIPTTIALRYCPPSLPSIKIASTLPCPASNRLVQSNAMVNCSMRVTKISSSEWEVQNKQNILSELCRWFPMAFSLTSPLTLWKTDKLSTGFTIPTKQNVKKKFGMKSDDIISLKSWKLAIHIFWRNILKLDLLKSFSCDSCGDRPSTLVFDGIALGVQIKNVESFKDKMRLVLGRQSEKKRWHQFEDRTFLRLKKNKRLLEECVKRKVWPKDVIDHDLNQGEPRVAQNDEGFDQFMTMIDQQDMNGPVPEGLLTLMANLASCSTSNLFQAS